MKTIVNFFCLAALGLTTHFALSAEPAQSVRRADSWKERDAAARLRVVLEDEPWAKRTTKEIEAGAKSGEPGAKLALAGLYSQGRDVPRDPERATALVRETAEAGFPPGCYLIGASYLIDDPGPAGGVIVGNYKLASEWLEKAAAKGHVEAAHELGELYYYGKLERDFKLAAKWLRMAAEAGDRKAAELLPDLYFFNHPGWDRNRTEAIRWMRIVARETAGGWHDVRVRFARSLLGDNPSPEEKAEAVQWLRQAMQDGSPQAEATLDVLGESVPEPDNSRVQALVDQCGMAPGTPACWRAARMYENGRGVPKDFRKALEYYARCGTVDQMDWIHSLVASQSAEGIVRILASPDFVAPKDWPVSSLVPNDPSQLTNAAARMQLAELLWKGSGALPRNPTVAVEWFRRAASSGSAPAMLRLGDLWRDGVSGKADPAEAVRWYRRAATAGLAAAQLRIGEAYRDGLGVEKDNVEAFVWLQLAAEQVYTEAKQAAEQLRPSLGPGDVETAVARGEQLRKAPSHE